MQNRFKLYLLSTLLVCAIISNVNAQDPIFGQFYAAPTHLNPAMTGVFEGSFRINANYREQWQSVLPNEPFRTMAVGGEYKHQVFRGDYAAFSLNALSDQAGDANYQQNKANLGFSYLKQLSGNKYRTSNQYLVAGAQAGFGQYALKPQNLWFSEQFNTTTASVDYGANNGENFTDLNSDAYLDFNAGLLWYAIFDDNFSLFAGGAMHHLSQPGISFMNDEDEVLRTRWVGHIGGEIPFTRQLSLLPAVMLTGQGVSNTSIFGANFRYTNHDWNEVAMRIGMWGHMSNKFEKETLLNSLIFTAIVEVERWNVGISYDVNTSSVTSATNGRGAFELSLIYTHPSKQRVKVKCPKY